MINTNSKKRKVALITGITGQDGSLLSQFLLEKEYEVYGLVRDDTHPNLFNLKYLNIINHVKLIKANLLDLSFITRTISDLQPDEVYNLAAQSSVGLSFKLPTWTIEFNIKSTSILLDAIRNTNSGSKFYQASSSEMFGNVIEKDLPITEETILHPVSPYGISKAASHWIAVNYRETYGLFVCCGILFNHESVLRGPNFVTSKIINSAIRISEGHHNILELGNINIYRDWGYAPDFVKGMWLMLQNDTAGDYILCSGEVHSLKGFAEEVFSILNLDINKYLKINNELYRPLELKKIYGDNSKARNVLGWKYDISFQDLIINLIKDKQEYINRMDA